MKNYLSIVFTQNIPAWLQRTYLRILKTNQRKDGKSGSRASIEDVDHFKTASPKTKCALLLFSPSAWIDALCQFPNIRLYNNSGFIYSIVKALNLNGYVVDIVDPMAGGLLDKRYDLCVAHGGYCKSLLDRLESQVPIFQYVSGLYWKSFIEESNQRYSRFNQKYKISQNIVHRRNMVDIKDGEEYLTNKADTLFTIHCPRMIEAYGEYANKFHLTGLGAYTDPLFKVDLDMKDYDQGGGNFIYVGGSGGNLQKGLDILIEAFVETPQQHLYIYCKVESEIMKYCKKQLSSPNIHYIYHWRYKPFHENLKKLLLRVNFSIHAPINTGWGTAFSATLGVGMIPVGYIDLPKDDSKECSVLTDSWQVADLITCISKASEKSPEWCAKASRGAVELYNKHCNPDKVEANFIKMFSEA